MLSICSSVCLFKETIIGPLKFKMADIRHLENRHDDIFFCQERSDLDIISQTGAEWHIDCADMVEIETRCKVPILRTFGRIQWHFIPEPRITLHIVATWWIHWFQKRMPHAVTWRNQCHDRATLQGVKLHPPYWKSFFAILYILMLKTSMEV